MIGKISKMVLSDILSTNFQGWVTTFPTSPIPWSALLFFKHFLSFSGVCENLNSLPHLESISKNSSLNKNFKLSRLLFTLYDKTLTMLHEILSEDSALHEKCPKTELFLVRIFQYSD